VRNGTEVTEQDLAETLGVARETLRDMRQKELRKGEHWRLEGGQVVLSAAGEAKIRARIGLAAAPGAGEADGMPAPAPAGSASLAGKQTARVRVCRMFRNPRVVGAALGCRLLGENCVHLRRCPEQMAEAKCGTMVRLKMRTAQKLRPGMDCMARQIGGDLWELAQRLPRWPGRW
jgi:hypothetical protein